MANHKFSKHPLIKEWKKLNDKMMKREEDAPNGVGKIWWSGLDFMLKVESCIARALRKEEKIKQEKKNEKSN